MLFHCGEDSLTILTPAKLNLFLEVVARRSDGFHEINTLMVSVGLYDTLRFIPSPSEEISLTVTGCGNVLPPHRDRQSEIPEGRGNLVVRAAELLRETTGTSRGVCIELHKRIPAAAGLAGGSSDAAATLVGLNRIWHLGLSLDDLQDLAGRLGSDVPFFLSASAAICRGRGEIVEPFRLPSHLYFVVVRPPTGLPTAEVFKHCRPTGSRRSVEEMVAALVTGNLGQASRRLHNGLMEPALALNEDVKQLRNLFTKLPVLGHLMSGSGTSYFGICAQRKHARTVAARLKAARIGNVFTVESRA